MRQQTSDMSIQDLSEVDRKLGENKGLLTNAFQVLSDPDVKIPLEKNVPGPFADLAQIFRGLSLVRACR
ncbi:TPR repeat region-containing protein [Mycolicibacterium smegmatis]|uniref:TPR repeat region-containing protein n=1 Tax=Mycolicibacterium smegmatis TaxID=1772 RepID=UPI003AF33E93